MKTTFENSKCWMLLFVLFFALNSIGQNLLVNPDAETGDLTGWVDPDDVWGVGADITPHGGNYFFWPTRTRALSYTQIYQDVDVSSYTSDNYFQLTGWLANWDQSPHDKATLAVAAFDASGNQLFYASRDHRNPVWGYYEITAQIPSTCTILRVFLIATRYVGAANDGYFDDLSIVISNEKPTVYANITSAGNKNDLEIGNTLQLWANTTGGSDNSYSWSSSYDNIASVDQTGLVTAHASGNITIQAIGNSTNAIAYFNLVAHPQNYLRFTNPEAGIEWLTGSDQLLTWEMDGSIASATLYWSSNDGADWKQIATINSASDQGYNWTLPQVPEPLNNCVLKLEWSGGESISQRFSIVLLEGNNGSANGNLLINPDAETGNISPWVDPDDAWGVSNEITPHGGSYFFYPNKKNLETTLMYQDVDVSAYPLSYFHLSGWLANWDQSPHDKAALVIEALDAGGGQLLYISRDHRNPVWGYYEISAQIPSACSTLRVYLVGTRFVGDANDAYFDDLSLTIDNNASTVNIIAAGGKTDVQIGTTLQLTANTTGGVDNSYNWSSSYDAIATVNSNGLVSAHSVGEFTIQAIGTTTGYNGYITLTAIESGSEEGDFILDEDFDDAPFPPEGWMLSQQNATSTWAQGNVEDADFNTIDPTSINSAFCSYIAEDQNEILFSPNFELTSGEASLEFYVGYNSEWIANASLYLMISKDNGENWENLWEAQNDGNPWGWRKQSLNLNSYVGYSQLALAWQYYGNDGDIIALDNVSLIGEGSITGVEDKLEVTGHGTLSQNYPNPVIGRTEISYNLTKADYIEISIYNALGQPVKSLVKENLKAGKYTVEWNGQNDYGQPASSGLYVYRIKTTNSTSSKRMMVIR